MKLLNWTRGDTVLVTVFSLLLGMTCLLTVMGYWLGCMVFAAFLPAFRTYDPRANSLYWGHLRAFLVSVIIVGFLATCFNPIWAKAGFVIRYFRTVAVGEAITLTSFGVMMLVSHFTWRQKS